MTGFVQRLRKTPIRFAVAGLCVAAIGYVAYLAVTVLTQFETRYWDLPARVYAAPLEIYPGRALDRDEIVAELQRAGYRRVDSLGASGTYRPGADSLAVVTRPFRFPDGLEASHSVTLRFADGRIARIDDERGQAVPIMRLEPAPLGNIFPSHGEDRLVVEPKDIPPLLIAALKAIEDQRFDEHFGIDPRSIARALLVNLRSGEIQQGGSTLTQQLVKSYFLTNAQTISRKIREAIMAVVLELAYDKQALMTAYVNEVYLGQDGARAIHGFGLASRFYFGKTLTDLDLHEIALLVAALRGPSYYDPRRYPERARERRDLVLELLAARGVVTSADAAYAAQHQLDLVSRQGAGTSYYPAFIELVRRQLRSDYRDEDLATRGLAVFATLVPGTQIAAERALADGLERLEVSRALEPGFLEGAVVVTDPHSAEVLAVVGGRRAGFDGFNRALDAQRPIGSLVKPAVYLAALESGRYSLASPIDDLPVEVSLANGTVWSPRNFDDEVHGTTSLLRALTESFNMATVRLGMDIGPERVADAIARLGLDETPAPLPSLLLGALDLSPFEVAQVYNTLANGGYRAPLRAVTAVLDSTGKPLGRYPLEITEAVDPDVLYQLDQALVQVVERGTGRSARTWLPESLTLAGKTGTSDEYRDSWFAGFTGNRLAVVWVGADDNAPTGMTGAAGALTVWAPLVASIDDTQSFAPPRPATLDDVWIEYATGLAATPRCADAVALALPSDATLEAKPGCGLALRNLGRNVKRWVERLVD